ncbi:hypothetical protein COCCADRAFT_112355, partial [Bipolaris zeicola 26-R-13]
GSGRQSRYRAGRDRRVIPSLGKCPTTGPVLISCGACLACIKREHKWRVPM